jgi:hypothetical protein
VTRGRMTRGRWLGLAGSLTVALVVGTAAASSASVRGVAGPPTATNLVLVAGTDFDFPPLRGSRALSASPIFEVTGASLELDVRRTGGTVQVRQGGALLPLHPRSVLGGLPDFLRWKLLRADGTVQASAQVDVCPMPGTLFAATAWGFNSSFNVDPANPATPSKSPYPQECGDPLTTRARWGFPTGWAVQMHIAVPDDTPPGSYTVDVTVNPDGAVNESDRTDNHVRMPVDVIDIGGGALAPQAAAEQLTNAATAARTLGAASSTGRPAAAGRAPGGPVAGSRPADRTGGPVELPDLVPLPSQNIVTRHTGPADLLRFNSTMANLGAGPLQIDGFQAGAPDGQMRAEQVLFHNGVEVTRHPAGTLIFDEDEGEWEFDFLARYRLLDPAGAVVASSGKIGFCMADVHQLDARGGFVIPDVTGFIGCFGPLLRSVREVIDPGWGDEYDQITPDQELDITNVPNGTYRIQILADPDHKLREASRDNNASLRTVVLGGVPGARTVVVPPIDGVDTEAAWAAAHLPF